MYWMKMEEMWYLASKRCSAIPSLSAPDKSWLTEVWCSRICEHQLRRETDPVHLFSSAINAQKSYSSNGRWINRTNLVTKSAKRVQTPTLIGNPTIWKTFQFLERISITLPIARGMQSKNFFPKNWAHRHGHIGIEILVYWGFGRPILGCTTPLWLLSLASRS